MTDAPNFTTQAIDWLQSQRSYEEHVQTLVELLEQAHAQGRQEGFAEAREMAARQAEKHKGAATQQRLDRGQRLSFLPSDAQDEIQAEERGEDIAAEIIARRIRALQPTNEGSGSDD